MTSEPPRWTRIGSVAEFAAAALSRREVDGLDLLVCRMNGMLHVLHNRCPHAGQPLDGGRLVGGSIQCPYHGAAFDVLTGKALSGPAIRALHRFAVQVEGDALWADLSVRPPSVMPWATVAIRRT